MTLTHLISEQVDGTRSVVLVQGMGFLGRFDTEGGRGAQGSIFFDRSDAHAAYATHVLRYVGEKRIRNIQMGLGRRVESATCAERSCSGHEGPSRFLTGPCSLCRST